MVLNSECRFVQTSILARYREAYCRVIHVWLKLWLDHVLIHDRLSILVDVLPFVNDLLHALQPLLLQLVSSIHHFKLEFRIL